jgi:hypothetical protein
MAGCGWSRNHARGVNRTKITMRMTIRSYGQLPRSYDQKTVRTMPRHRARMSVHGAAVNHFAIAHVKDAMAIRSGFGVVGDHHDGLAEIFIELAQKT